MEKKSIDPKKLEIMATNGGRDVELDLGLEEGSHTGSCFGEEQKEQIYSRIHVTYRCQFIHLLKS